MELKILEIDARKILETYTGANNQILEWQYKFKNTKKFKLARTQALYIVNNHEITPKIARKYVEIVSAFGESLMEKRRLTTPPQKIWVEKLLTETEKAYHIWGKIIDADKLHAFWIPKASIIQEERTLDREIDYSKYDVRPLMDHQKVAVEKLLANNKYILADDMGLGKGLVTTTLIYTPKGRVEIGSLKIGDKVIGSDGLPYNITGVYPQGIKDTHRITFNDGTSIVTDEDHLWSVFSKDNGINSKSKNRSKRTTPLVLSTKQLLNKNEHIIINGKKNNKNKEYKIKTHYKQSNGSLKWQIPITKPIIFDNKKQLPIDPYLLGMCLGDGHIKNTTVSFTIHENDFEEIFGNYVISEMKNKRNNVRSGSIVLGESIKTLGLNQTRSHTKFIPEIYKYSSIDDRLSILQGLMDSDGYCNQKGRKKTDFTGTEYCTVSEKLCDDVIEIVHSLGGIARKSSRYPKYTYNDLKKTGKKAFRVNIKLPEGINPFRLKRKSKLYNTPQKYKVGRYIKNIEYNGKNETICISVDSPDKLYVAEHAVVTHNTTSAVIASLESNVKKVLIVCPASLKINWQREIEQYTRKKTLIVEGGKWGSTFEYYIINYDILKNYHLIDPDNEDNNYTPILNENFDLAIVDEAHYISNTTAQRTKLMNEILGKIPKVWLLTGTPMTSRPINYFNLLRIVNSPITLNWQRYVKRYCKGFRFKTNGRYVWSTSGAANLDELREHTKSVVLRRLKSDVLDLPEKIITPVWLDLESKFYSDEWDEFLKISEDEKGKESVAITLARLTKVRQIIAIEKVQYTCELIDKFLEQNKKVLVFTNYTMSLEMLQEKYAKKCVVVDGRMTKNQKQDNIDRFQKEKKIKVFIANIKAGGVGHTLTAAEGVIMNDLSFVPSDHSQAEDRTYRIGQKNSVLVYYPIFENTIEMIIHNMIQKKKNNIDQVMGDGEYSESFTKELFSEIF